PAARKDRITEPISGSFAARISARITRARYYDPATGRWTSQDPIGFGAEDNNLYRYVKNGQLNGVDPNGLEEKLPHPVKAPFLPLVLRDENVPQLKLPIEKSEPNLGYFGQFSWQVAWELDKPTRTGGMVIQFLHVTFNIEKYQVVEN